MIDESQWRSWPPKGSSAAAFDASSPSESYECPDISTENLVGQAVDCVREWGVLGDKTAAEETPSATVITAESVWRSPDAHPFVLLLSMVNLYGEESVYWLPETVKTTFERGGRMLSNSSFTKIMAARTLVATPSPWRQWEVFHWVARGLSGVAPNFTFLEEPDLGDLAVCADLMRLTDRSRKTGIEVDKYVGAAFRAEGIHYAPPPLDFAQRELEQPKIQCEKCLAVHRDDNDTKCVACGSRNLTRLPYDFAASRDATKELWDARHKMPLVVAVEGLPDTAPGNAVYRLLTQWDRVNTARSQLLQQLRMIGGRR